MWYYVKDKKKIGPVSDTAIHDLFARGEINTETKLWAPKHKGWVPMKDTSIYEKITTKRKSHTLISLNARTYFLRAILVSLAICLGYEMYFLVQSLELSCLYASNGGKPSSLAIDMAISEAVMVNSLVKYIILVVLIFSLVAAFKWLQISAKISKSIYKRYPYSNIISATSIFMPILNLMLPPSVLWNISKASFRSIKKNGDLFYFSLIVIWSFFWIMAIVMIFISKYAMPQSANPDMIESIYFAKIYFQFIYLMLIIFSLILVSGIYSMQKKYLNLHSNI